MATPSGGTVTSVSSGNLNPLFSSSVANATSTPAISYSLSAFGAHQFFGNNTGSSAAPTAIQPSFSDLAGTATTAQLPAAVVLNNVSNTYSGTNIQDLSSSGQTIKLPTKADPSTPATSEIWL